MRHINFSVFSIATYIFLLFIICLPFIIHTTDFIAGGDFVFQDYGNQIQRERLPYFWQDSDGMGGLSTGRYGALVFSEIVSLFDFLPIHFLQLFLIVCFYSIAYWGAYLLFNELSLFIVSSYELRATSLLSLFYCTNLFALNFLKVPTYLFLSFFAFTPIIVFLFVRFTITGNRKYLLLLSIVTLINSYTLVNVTNGLIQILTIFIFIIPFISRKNITTFVIAFFFFFFLNAPSFIEYSIQFSNPDSLSTAQSQVEITSTAKEVQKKLFGINHIIHLYTGDLFGIWWNSSGQIDNFSHKKIYNTLFYQTILLIPMILVALSLWKYKNKVIVIYFVLIFLLCVAVLSMYGFNTFTPLWDYFFQMPASSVFRNSAKFWVPTILALCTFLLPLMIFKRIILYIFMFYLVFLNLYSISGNLFNQDMFITLPNDYQIDVLNNKFASVNASGVGILYPAKNFFLYGFNWGYMGYSPLLLLQDKVALFHKGGDALSQSNASIYEKFKDENIENLSPGDYQKFGIKYVILQKDINYKVFGYSDNYSGVLQYLEHNFKIIVDTEHYTIFETYEGFTPLVASNNLTYKEISPTTFKLYISSLNKAQDIRFMQSFHSGWSVYLQPNTNRAWCNYTHLFETKLNITECIQDKRSFNFAEIHFLYERDVFDDSHTTNEIYTNTWTIDPEYIKQNFSKDFYKQNPDGSIDVELVLYFKPQSYFYLGLLISGTTLLGCFGYLIYDWRKKRKLTKDHEN